MPVTRKLDNSKPWVLAVAGVKGGTGKTTLAAHLAAAIGTKARPAVLCDLDPQAAASSWLLPDAPPVGLHLAADLEDGRPARTVAAPKVPSVRVAPGHLDLAEWDGEFERVRSRLPRVLQTDAAPDLVVLDLPPSWGAILAGALFTADAVLVVVEARELGVARLGDLLDLIDQVREERRGLPELLGVLPNKANRTRLSRGVIERLERRYRQTLAPVREATRIAETPRLSATLWETPGEMPAKDDLAALVATVRRAMKRGKA